MVAQLRPQQADSVSCGYRKLTSLRCSPCPTRLFTSNDLIDGCHHFYGQALSAVIAQ